MSCIPYNLNKEQIDNLAAELMGVEVEQLHASTPLLAKTYIELANNVITLNGGHDLDKNPDGSDSKMFADLMRMYNNDRQLALIDRLSAYNVQFTDNYGKWYLDFDANGKLYKEPTVQELLDDDYYAEFKTTLNLNSDTIAKNFKQEIDRINISELFNSNGINKTPSFVKMQQGYMQEQETQNEINTNTEDTVNAFIAMYPTATEQQIRVVRDRALQKYTLRELEYFNKNVLLNVTHNITTKLARMWDLDYTVDPETNMAVVDLEKYKNELNESDRNTKIRYIKAGMLHTLLERMLSPKHRAFATKILSSVFSQSKHPLELQHPERLSKAIIQDTIDTFSSIVDFKKFLGQNDIIIKDDETAREVFVDLVEKDMKQMRLGKSNKFGKIANAFNWIWSFVKLLFNTFLNPCTYAKLLTTKSGRFTLASSTASAVATNMIFGDFVFGGITIGSAALLHNFATTVANAGVRKLTKNLCDDFILMSMLNTDIETIQNIDYINSAVFNKNLTEDAVIASLQENLARRITSLQSIQHSSEHTQAAVSKLNQILALGKEIYSESITTQKQKRNKTDEYLHSFVTTALSDVTKYLNYTVTQNTYPQEEYDFEKLWFIKTDVIGAYDEIFSNMLKFNVCNISDAYNKENSELKEAIDTTINSLNELKSQYQLLLKQALTTYINNKTDEYWSSTIPENRLNDFKYNLIDELLALDNQFELGILDKYVLPTKTSSSSLVRFVHNSITEILTNMQIEVDEVSAKANNQRIRARYALQKNSKGKFSLGKTLHKIVASNILAVLPYNSYKLLLERDRSLHLGNNFVSDVNKSKYDDDRKEFISDLINGKVLKGVKFPTNKLTGRLDWSEDEDDKMWKLYHKAIIDWEAGAKSFNPDGSVAKYGKPRAHRMYLADYYKARIDILGKDGIALENSQNADIERIKQHAREDIEYVDPTTGETKTINLFISSNLTQADQDLLWSLELKKRMNSSPYIFDIVDGKIEGVIEKRGEDLELAERFKQWSEFKASQYEGQEKNTKMYDAIKSSLENKVYELENIINDPDISETTKQEYTQQYDDALAKLVWFKNNSTQRTWNPNLFRHLSKKRRSVLQFEDDLFQGDQEKTDLLYELKDLYRKRQLIYQKVKDSTTGLKDLDRLGSGIYKTLKKWDERISELRTELGLDDIYETPENQSNFVLDFTDMFVENQVQKLDLAKNPVEDYYDWLIRNGEVNVRDLMYFDSKTQNPDRLKIFSQWEPYEDLLDIYPRLKEDVDSVYVDSPLGIFEEIKSKLANPKFDLYADDVAQTLQIDKDTYSNKHQLQLIKLAGMEDLHKTLVDMMNQTWANYEGYTRKWQYSAPQREGSWQQIAARNPMRGLSLIKKRLTTFNTRQADEINEQYFQRADRSVLESNPSRWLSNLENPGDIDTDLFSSVTDALVESVKYKYRKKLIPILELLKYQAFGGDTATPDAAATDIAQMIQNEISSGLYGRSVTGFGKNGRLTKQDQGWAKLTMWMRSVLHQRLMGGNPMSLVKNGNDSTQSLISEILSGKYIVGRNLGNPLNIARFIFHKFPSYLFGTLGVQSTKAVTKSQGLMRMLGISDSFHERYENTNQYRARRIASNAISMAPQAVDYSSKLALTEYVFDSYRLVWNPMSGKYEFLNHNDCERVYAEKDLDGSVRGRTVWENAKVTLRDAYTHDYVLGYTKPKKTIKAYGQTFNVLDLIRPVKKGSIRDDKRSIALENRVRNTIKTLSSVVNGMLDKEDKNVAERNYIGSVVFALRGYMPVQYGEFNKEGHDFAEHQTQFTDKDIQHIMHDAKSILKNNMSKKTQATNKRYRGQLDWGSGFIGTGAHKSLSQILLRNAGFSLLTLIPGFVMLSPIIKKYITSSNNKHSLTPSEYSAIVRFSTSLHLILATIYMCSMCLAWSDDDPDDPYSHFMYVALLASISERFPQLGKVFFATTAAELVSTITVGQTLLDDIRYVVSAFGSLFNEEKAQTILKSQNAFYGKKTIHRDLTYLMSDFGLDFHPYALMLTLLEDQNMLPKELADFKDYTIGSDGSWFDLCLNSYKYRQKPGRDASAKFYKKVIPTPYVGMISGALGVPIIKETGQKRGVKPAKSPYNINYGNSYKYTSPY